MVIWVKWKYVSGDWVQVQQQETHFPDCYEPAVPRVSLVGIARHQLARIVGGNSPDELVVGVACRRVRRRCVCLPRLAVESAACARLKASRLCGQYGRSFCGLFANEVLPLRTGEVLRCYLQARWSSIPFSVTLASAFIERIFDGFWLVLCLFITVKLVPGLPRYVMDGAAVLGVLIIAGALLVAIAMFHRQRAKSALSEHGWHRHLRVLIDDLHMMGHSKYLYYSAMATIPYLLMQIVPFYALMHAYDFADASWGVAAVLMIVLRLGSAVPQAPGNVGAFQALAVVLLSHVFGYDTGICKALLRRSLGCGDAPAAYRRLLCAGDYRNSHRRVEPPCEGRDSGP